MFPYYLSYGMTAEQYWSGDPWLVVAYREAHRLKTEQENFNAWLYGFYNYNAFSVVQYNVNRDPKKGQKAKDYFKEPIRITPLTEREKAEKAEKGRQEVIDFFTSFEKDFNAKKENTSTGADASCQEDSKLGRAGKGNKSEKTTQNQALSKNHSDATADTNNRNSR